MPGGSPERVGGAPRPPNFPQLPLRKRVFLAAPAQLEQSSSICNAQHQLNIPRVKTSERETKCDQRQLTTIAMSRAPTRHIAALVALACLMCGECVCDESVIARRPCSGHLVDAGRVLSACDCCRWRRLTSMLLVAIPAFM
jgi:hypothetical protein